MVAVLAALFGAVIGALLGLVGGGGGILAVPALVYGLGLPLSQAVPGSLLVIGSASIVAVAPRARTDVNWRLAAVVGAAGAPTALAGGLAHRGLDDRWLMLAFAAPRPRGGAVRQRVGAQYEARPTASRLSVSNPAGAQVARPRPFSKASPDGADVAPWRLETADRPC